MLFGECKFKQRDTPTHQLEWLKSGIMTPPNAGENVEQQELSLIAEGNAKWHSHPGRELRGFLQNETYSYRTIQQLHLVFTQRS